MKKKKKPATKKPATKKLARSLEANPSPNSHRKIGKVAKATEQKIDEMLGGQMSVPQAVIYSVKETKGGGLQVVKRHQGNDIYDLLGDSYTADIARTSTYIAVLTCGWAAPVEPGDDDFDEFIQPSEHPRRRRVRLVITASRHKGVASVLRFADKPNEIMLDEDKAKGSLADAIHDLFPRPPFATFVTA